MAAQKTTTAKAAAATPAQVGRTPTFGPDQCHHRSDAGQPDCNETKQKGRNLCPTHEKVWQAAAKLRREERAKTGTPAPNAKGQSQRATAPEPTTKARGSKAARKNAVTGEGSKPNHPMTVLRAPVQRVETASSTSQLVAPRRARQSK